MEILKHFETGENTNFTLLTLKDGEWNDFLNKLPIEYRSCFISNEDLANRIKIFNTTKEEELDAKLPTEGKIKSGDFGEILAYLLFKEIYKEKNIDGPKKWIWKEANNVPAPYSDVILFSIKGNKYSEDDLLVSVESKMKATSSNSYAPVQSAVNGAEKDCVSRLAKSLPWLREKYKNESLKEGAPREILIKLVDDVNRFIQSEEFGLYQKQINAIAFVDKNLIDAEIKKPLVIQPHLGISTQIYIVGIKDLKGMYEKVYSEIYTI